jgi:hypothetical protein
MLVLKLMMMLHKKEEFFQLWELDNNNTTYMILKSMTKFGT